MSSVSAAQPTELLAQNVTGQVANVENSLAQEDFRRLEMLTQACPTDFCAKVLRFPTACSHAAMTKNRYPNILPDEWTRVKLKKDCKDRDEAADYINANYLLGGHYIAAQAPLPSTFGDFWCMVWQHRTPVVVMLTKLMERGRPKADCYWPEQVGQTFTYGGFEVTLEKYSPGFHYETRTFLIGPVDRSSQLSAPRRVVHYLLSSWPDFGAPTDTVGIRCLVSAVEKAREDNTHLNGPTIVHCSAGVGRSGTFIAIADAVHRVNSHRPIDVLGTVLQMRKERTGMIQTAEQYSFVLRAIGDHVSSIAASAPLSSSAALSTRKKTLHGSSPSVTLANGANSTSPATRRTFSLSDLECVVAGGPRRPGQ